MIPEAELPWLDDRAGDSKTPLRGMVYFSNGRIAWHGRYTARITGRPNSNQRAKLATYQRKRPPVALGGVVFYEGISADDLSSTDLLAVALLGVTGSNKDLMVEHKGR